LANKWTSYIFSNLDKQIQRRIEEWFLSGMCERRQAVYQENDPAVEVERADGTKVAMPMSEATRRERRAISVFKGKAREGSTSCVA
jgi:hypothetical protein